MGLALDTGLRPIFFHNPTEPFLPYLDKLEKFIPSSYADYTPRPIDGERLGIRSINLSRAWDTTQTFCALLNYAAASGRKIPQETLLNTMASVMYRLLDIKFISGTLDETIRLSLLGFCSHIFLQWPSVKLPPHHLSTEYRKSLLGLTIPLAPQMSLWFLVMGDMSLFSHEDEVWLRPWQRAVLELCGAATWNEARVTLKGFLWIDFLHDKAATKIFSSVQYS